MQTNSNITIAHQLPGRLRVTIPAMAKRRALARAMKLDLAGVSGITRVSANGYCGSLTITYDPKIVGQSDLMATIGDLLGKKPLALNDRRTGRKDRPPTETRSTQAVEKKGRVVDLEPAVTGGFWNPWNLGGTAMVGLGIAGAVLPIVPTVPPLLLAAYCYSRGSQRFYDRLTNHHYLGKLIKDHRDGNGMSVKTKAVMIALLWVSMGLSILFFVSGAPLRMMMLLIGTAVTIHILRMKTAA